MCADDERVVVLRLLHGRMMTMGLLMESEIEEDR